MAVKLSSVITTKDDTVRVRFSDNDDQAKAKVWLNVEVPPEELKAPPQTPGFLQEVDGLLFGKPKGSANLDGHREKTALNYLKKVIDERIRALKP